MNEIGAYGSTTYPVTYFKSFINEVDEQMTQEGIIEEERKETLSFIVHYCKNNSIDLPDSLVERISYIQALFDMRCCLSEGRPAKRAKTQGENSPPFDKLPCEISSKIFYFISDPKDLYSVIKTCKAFRDVIYKHHETYKNIIVIRSISSKFSLEISVDYNKIIEIKKSIKDEYRISLSTAEVLSFFSNLERLELSDFKDDIGQELSTPELIESEAAVLKEAQGELQEIIKSCEKLEKLAELTIENNHAVSKFPHIVSKSLKNLTIKNCGSLTEIADFDSLPELKQLLIKDCPVSYPTFSHLSRAANIERMGNDLLWKKLEVYGWSQNDYDALLGIGWI